LNDERKPDPETLTTDLESRDPGRVTAALRELDRRLLAAEHVPLHPPPAGLLDVLGNSVDDELVPIYLRVLRRYPFEPPLERHYCLRQGLEAVLCHGGSYSALRQAQDLMSPLTTDTGVTAGLQYLAERGVKTDRDADQAGWLLSYLLDSTRFRAETIAGVIAWMSDPALAALVRSEAGRLTADELARLGISAEPT
jgi:hypothetical protein